MTPKHNRIANLVVGYFFVFFGGFVTANNMSLLLGHNEAYEASWFKVMIAIFLAVAGIYMTRNSHFDSNQQPVSQNNSEH